MTGTGAYDYYVMVSRVEVDYEVPVGGVRV